MPTTSLPGIGALRDYCAWTWGDALFVILDNYWHSPALVDTALHERDDGNNSGRKNRDWWGLTLGDTQYQWFRRTLEQSKARYKFVFAHHVLGSGRGGIDEAHLYEWGGQNQRGMSEFKQRRPGWELPIHALMVKHGVTAFFQGHDHLYAKQTLDGIIYQEVPQPSAVNSNSGPSLATSYHYSSGKILSSSGHMRVTVTPTQVIAAYVRSWQPSAETNTRKNGQVDDSWSVSAP